MIRGMFRAVEDQQLLAELRASSHFRKYVDKLRSIEAKATADLMYATPQDLPSRQGYARAIAELLSELTKTGD
jgi:hypothetical protein